MIVPQVSHSNTAIRHAVLAVSTLSEYPIPLPYERESTLRGQNQIQALKWYTKSVSDILTQSQKARDTDQVQMILISCILFINFEMQQMHVSNVIRLLGNGFRLIAAYRESSTPMPRPCLLDSVLIPMFARQIVLLQLHPTVTGWFETSRRLLPPCQMPLQSLSDARSLLYGLLSRAYEVIFHNTIWSGSDAEPGALYNQQKETLHSLALWHCALAEALSQGIVHLHGPERSTYHCLLCYFDLAMIWLSTCVQGTELAFDKHFDQFERILSNAEEYLQYLPKYKNIPSFNFEMGVIPPLYFTGWKCRSPTLRRRALELLEQAPPQESLFVADLEIKVLKKIIELEEINIRGRDGDENDLTITPAENDRLSHVVVHWEDNQGRRTSTKLLVRRYLRGDNAELCVKWGEAAID